jgi:proline iminopeptidase
MHPPEYNEDDIPKLNSEAFETVLQDASLINKNVESDDNTIFKYNLLTLFRNRQHTQFILDSDLFQNINFKDRLSEIAIPAIVLLGKHNIVVPIQFAQDSYDNLGSNQKELVIFEKSGYSPRSTEPDLFADKVVAFINQNK